MGFFFKKKHSKLFCYYQQSDSKVAMKGQKIQKGQHDAEEKCEQSQRTDNSETYYRALEIKTIWHWQEQSKTNQKIQNRQMDPWTRIPGPETHTQLSQLIFDESKGNPMEKEQLFNKRVQTGYSHAKTGRKKKI